MVIHEDFEKSETDIETYELVAKLKISQENDAGFPNVISLDDFNEKR